MKMKNASYYFTEFRSVQTLIAYYNCDNEETYCSKFESVQYHLKEVEEVIQLVPVQYC